MAVANNAVCSICGKPYYMCNSCKSFKSLYPWKMHTDTSEHFKIYQIIHGYSTGVYNKQETKSKLQNVDLSDVDSFREHIKILIKEIMSYCEKENIESTKIKSSKKNKKVQKEQE